MSEIHQQSADIEGEKHIGGGSVAEVNEVESAKVHTKYVDLAARAHVEHVDYTPAESKSVLRKIDWHLMPMLVWICMCFLSHCIPLLTLKTAFNTPISRLCLSHP